MSSLRGDLAMEIVREFRALMDAVGRDDDTEDKVIAAVLGSLPVAEQLGAKRFIYRLLAGEVSDAELVDLWHQGTEWQFGEPLRLRRLLAAVAEAIDERVLEAVADVLFRDWNPLGLADKAAADRQYEGCITSIALMLRHGASEDRLAAFLADAHRRRSSRPVDPDRDRRVAARLLAAYAKISAGSADL
jgi:hypothetical protein